MGGFIMFSPDINFLFFIVFHLFIFAYIFETISPPHTPCPFSSPHSFPLPHPTLPGRTCSALSSNFVEEKT
jgi:hypothetical protein